MMLRVLFILRLGAMTLCLLAGLGGTAVFAQARQIIIDDGQVSMLELSPGRTITIETNADFADILIGNTDVIDVFPLTDRSLYIQAKAAGVTNVTLYSMEKQLLEVIDVRVQTDFSDVEDAIRGALPGAQVSVSNVNDRIRLTGQVRDTVERDQIIEIAQQFSTEPVISALRVNAAQQVELDVRILEVSRNSGRALGVELAGNAVDTGERRITTGAAVNAVPFGTFVGELLEASGIQLNATINALEAKGLARRLANPKLVTTSGVEADFVVGGEVPTSVANRDVNGEVAFSTEFREFGVSLRFTPTVLADQLIRLNIQPEVSDIDQSIDVNGNPGFITRRANTTVSLRNGQSFAIAGLLQADNTRNVNQLPWLGQVPVLGALFSSREFQRDETDLVILVTPRLVQPAGPGTPLRSPLDATRSSNDVELFLLGMVEVDRNLIRRFRDGEGVVGPFGHMIDLEFEDGLLAK